jgi:hypothetical protein
MWKLVNRFLHQIFRSDLHEMLLCLQGHSAEEDALNVVCCCWRTSNRIPPQRDARKWTVTGSHEMKKAPAWYMRNAVSDDEDDLGALHPVRTRR